MLRSREKSAGIKKSRYSVALRTVLVYLVLSILWIVLSDIFVVGLPIGQEVKDGMQTFKGLIFVGLSTLLLYFIVRSFTYEHEMLLIQLTKDEEQLAALTQHLQTSIESERSRISREIHDDLGQTMTALRMDIAMVSRSCGQLSDESVRELVLKEFPAMISMVDSAIHSTRTIIRGLRPDVLDTLGLYNGFRWHVDDFTRRTNIGCSLSLPKEEYRFSAAIATALFRILQESLTNIVKHAQASHITIDVGVTDKDILLTIHDNGIGITAENKSKNNAYGLLGIRERVKGLDGSYSITGDPHSGTTVRIVIPRTKENIII